MDIIAAHQQGLIEKLADEAEALAGRPKDFGQRAVVLHHLYDHSRGNHIWALAEARRELRMARAFGRLRRKLSRWGWLSGRRERALAALGDLERAIGEESRARCAAAYFAYRLSGTRSLRDEAERRLREGLLELLAACHAARRTGEEMEVEESRKLFEDSQAIAADAVEPEPLEAAWAAVDATGLRRSARRLLGQPALDRALARDRKRGWRKIDRELRTESALPATFRANPAQHFYALQNVLAERRRQQWREECDREPGAFGLAA